MDFFNTHQQRAQKLGIHVDYMASDDAMYVWHGQGCSKYSRGTDGRFAYQSGNDWPGFEHDKTFDTEKLAQEHITALFAHIKMRQLSP